MAKHDQTHVSGYHEGPEAYAVFIGRLYDGPHQEHAEREDQRLAHQPEEAEALPAVAGDHLAHHQGADDARMLLEGPEAHEPD